MGVGVTTVLRLLTFFMLLILAILFMTVTIRIDLITSIIGATNISVGQFYIGGITILTLIVVSAYAVTRN